MMAVTRPLMTPRQLGAAVRERRLAAGLTQADLASRAGVSRRFVSELERGERGGDRTGRLVWVLRELGAAITIVDHAYRTVEEQLCEILGYQHS